jgi:ATP-dependent helicase/nuclease subunit A
MTNWTDDQKLAIDLRDKNLIVSAAAGSGKTAVLIERIFQIIKNGEVDISNILMITFTRKAASEMKEKLQKKLDIEIEKDLDNFNLRKQRVLLEASDIKTIDSFCLQVVKNHFNELELDLKFQIIDEKRNVELKTEILDRIFEEEYKNKDPRFIKLVETYGKLESDEEFRKCVIELYDFSQSNPEPSLWLEKAVEAYTDNIAEFEKTPVGQYFKVVIINRELKNIENYLTMEIDAINCGAIEYAEVYQDDLENYENMLNQLNNSGLSAFLNSSFVYKRLPNVKKDNKTPAHEDFKAARKDFKDRIKELTLDLESKLKEQTKVSDEINYFINLVSKFSVQLLKEKRRINLFDYNDIEHFALELLAREELNEKYKKYYKYICLDEYQDTNGVQEKIFNLISRENNMFYVGDLKQSIYRFRLADSSIFKSKVDYYENHEHSEALTLNKNFRSSQSVVKGVNSLFNHLMDGFFSAVKYKEEAQLVHGSLIDNNSKIETYIIDLESDDYISEYDDGQDEDEELVIDKIKKEAEICAKRIRGLVDSGGFTYKDFTILSNSIRFIVDPFKEIFDKYSIPVYGEVDTGFLKSLSVGFLIDYLEIIDNINNDLALINILKSPIYNFSLEELSLIRKHRQKGEFFIESLNRYVEGNEGLIHIKVKIKYFLKNITELKTRLNDQNLTDFTIKLLVDSKYYFTIFRKEDYEIESLNLKELLRLISEFEINNNSHLSGFLKYYRHIQKNEISIPSSSLISEEDNVVRIQTIHKSKGLEYENVFLVKMGDMWKNNAVKQINYHQKLGMGVKILDLENKSKTKTLNYEIINKALSYENLEDKLNLLYVAMTRAKNNLFLVGSVKKIEKYQTFNFDSIVKAKSMYDLILPIIFNDETAKLNFEVIVESVIIDKQSFRQTKDLLVYTDTVKDNYIDRSLLQTPKKLSATDFVKINSIEKALTRDLLKNSLKIKPDFLQTKKISSVEKGIIFHLVMELLDFNKSYTLESLIGDINELQVKGIIADNEKNSLDIEGIFGFLDSKIFKRIKKSQDYEKEKAFNLMIDPSVISEDYRGNNKILVQGIIDLYFTEGDKCILIDYKTDYVDKESITEKLDEYKKQLLLYKMALENIKVLQVPEAYLYFSKIREFIKIDFGG